MAKNQTATNTSLLACNQPRLPISLRVRATALDAGRVLESLESKNSEAASCGFNFLQTANQITSCGKQDFPAAAEFISPPCCSSLLA
jgi:hypothetical protein